MLCVLFLIVLWGFSLVTSYSGVITTAYKPIRLKIETLAPTSDRGMSIRYEGHQVDTGRQLPVKHTVPTANECRVHDAAVRDVGWIPLRDTPRLGICTGPCNNWRNSLPRMHTIGKLHVAAQRPECCL